MEKLCKWSQAPMANFLVGNELRSEIQSISKTGSADLAVAFWGRGANELLGIPDDASSIRIACDARSGACNPDAIEALLLCGARLVDVSSLHAKVYIGEGSMVVSSANASSNGLGEEGEEISFGLEAGYLSREAADIQSARSWFEVTFAKGRPVSINDLPELRDLWRPRRSKRPQRKADEQTFLNTLLEQPSWFNERNIKAVFYDTGVIPEIATETYKKSIFFNSKAYEESEPFYVGVERWGCHIDDYLIDFGFGEDGMSFNGVWRVQGFLDHGVMPVEQIEKPFGLKFSTIDRGKLARLVRNLDANGAFTELPKPMDVLSFSSMLKATF